MLDPPNHPFRRLARLTAQTSQAGASADERRLGESPAGAPCRLVSVTCLMRLTGAEPVRRRVAKNALARLCHVGNDHAVTLWFTYVHVCWLHLARICGTGAGFSLGCQTANGLRPHAAPCQRWPGAYSVKLSGCFRLGGAGLPRSCGLQRGGGGGGGWEG